jgi:hypothetical protein
MLGNGSSAHNNDVSQPEVLAGKPLGVGGARQAFPRLDTRMSSKRRPGLRSDFNLGGEQAEADPLLDRAFVEWAGYLAVESKTNPRRFLIGRTGSGKSAVLQRLEEVHPRHVIRINPEDLSLPYIVDLGVIRTLDAIDVHLDPLFIALWKHVLLVEIIRHRFNVDSPTKKRTVLQTLRDTFSRDASKQAALEYLEEFGESFWAETDERVREITTNFEERVKQAGGVSLDVPLVGEGQLGIEGVTAATTTVRRELADRYQRLVNETQLSRLNKMIVVLNEDILSSPQNFTYVVVDDLDRDWVDEKIVNDLVRCLFRAVLDVQRVANLKVIVALRTNIFDHLNFGARTGGQEEKFRSLVFRIQWTRRELLAMADERARISAEEAGIPEVKGISDLLPLKGRARGDPMDYILERTLLRPRDVIAFLNECLAGAAGKSRLTWADIGAAEARYSQNRLLGLRDEWKANYPGIDRAFEVFRGAPVEMGQKELTPYLDGIALLVAEPDFDGFLWVSDVAEPVWTGGAAPEAWADSYQPLVKLLYDIGFLGVGDSGGGVRYSYDRPGYADAQGNLQASTRYAVHPTFQPTLGIRASSGRRTT